jgi:hypothetical protein
MLHQELLASMEELENFPDPECDFDPPDPPDLYTFHTELIALRQALQRAHEELLRRLDTPAASAQPGLSQALAVQLGLLAGEMRAGGNTEHAERLLKLIESFS